MKIVLATGIYPPDIGGPATYVSNLAAEFYKQEMEVVVVTYVRETGNGERKTEIWKVVGVKKGCCPVLRWFRYAKALKKVGKDADIVYAFSSVSCGIPLWLARLKKPKKVLRLGGDFFWERYTDWGGKKGLREWYDKHSLVFGFWFFVSRFLVNTFNHIVFSTRFQEELYERHFKKLPPHSVIQNALPEGKPEYHVAHEPFRILFMGRLVAFKNLPVLFGALACLKNVRLAIVGGGPRLKSLKRIARKLDLENTVMFVAPVHKEEKLKILLNHDLLILPSLTEISPNVALEARAHGLPVLLTEETGLSAELFEAMILRDLSSVDVIVAAVEEVRGNYKEVAKVAAVPMMGRSWGMVAGEHVRLFEAFGSCLNHD